MPQKPTIDGCRLFVFWMLASTLSVACSSSLAGFLFSPIWFQDGFADFSISGFVLSQVFVGLSLGVAQWLVLRQYVLNAGWWVLATVEVIRFT
jgi:hypothetical protein